MKCQHSLWPGPSATVKQNTILVTPALAARAKVEAPDNQAKWLYEYKLLGMHRR